MEYKAYTYLLRFKPENKFYYGVRVKNIKLKRHPADDFMIHYTTSSKLINKLIAEHGVAAFEWEIRKTFDTAEQAIAWESRVLTRAKVLKHQHIWYNANAAGYKIATPDGRLVISATHKDKPKTEEHRQNLSLSQKGKSKINSKNKTPEYRALMSVLKSGATNPMYGKACTPERAANISAAKKGKPATNKGIPMSEEQKAAIRATKALTKVYLTCEHCNKTVYKPNYFQHHGNKCKQKPI